jgi:ComF family protein
VRICLICGLPLPDTGPSFRSRLLRDASGNLTVKDYDTSGNPTAKNYVPGEDVPFPGFTLCHTCTLHRPVFERARSCGIFQGRLRESILNLKYHRQWQNAGPLGRAMAKVASLELRRADVILPVPMHPVKEVIRGTNHARELAVALAYSLDLPVLEDALVRIRNTPYLSDLTKEERLLAMKGAFAIAPRTTPLINGMRIWLVDDVLTTGATANECSKILLELGAREVSLITVARSMRLK